MPPLSILAKIDNTGEYAWQKLYVISSSGSADCYNTRGVAFKHSSYD